MMKTRRNLLAAGLLAGAVPAFAQLGGLMGAGKPTGGGGNIDADVSSFLGRSSTVEMTASKAYLAVVSAFAKEEERAKYQSMFADLGKQTDPKESGAKFQQVKETAEAEIKRLSEAQDLEARTKALSADKQKLLANGVGNLMLAAFQGKDVVQAGQNLISGVGSNPTGITKIMPVKDAVGRLGGAISLAGASLPKIVNALKGANITVAAVSSSSKEEKIESI